MLHFLRANAWLVAVVALAIGALFVFVDPAPPREIMLATGVEGGAYHEFGRKLAQRLAQDGMTVRLQTTKGSVENLELLRAPDNEVSIALVQSGLAVNEDPGELRLLGSLFYEPFWVFYQENLELDSLRDLRGRTLAVGVQGSGTRAVATLVLDAHGLSEAGAANLQDLSGNAAADALLEGAVDAAMFVGAPGSDYVEKLLRDPRVRLFDLRRERAFRAVFPQLTTLTVGEGQLSLAENLPAADHAVLASVATFVVNDRFHPGLTPLVLRAVFDLLRNGGVLEQPEEFPQARPGDFPLTREAEHFHEHGLPFMMRYLPFWAASLFDRLIILLIPLLALLIPIFRAAPPLYRWRVRVRIYRWYKHLREVDQRIKSGKIEDTVEADLKALHELQDEILEVQVPLSYTDELYELHLHIEWVIRRLQRVKREEAEEDDDGGTETAKA
ncbi:MAG: TAXI family TRAP transporter solute-binding subunit [Opitutaceae bacterium]